MPTGSGPGGRDEGTVRGGRLADLRARVVGLDHRISQRLHVPSGPWRFFALLVAHSGDSPLWLVAGGAAWLWGTSLLKAVGARVIVANLVGAVATALLKLLVRRRRPRPSFAGLYHERLDQMSFPSGHATRVGYMLVLLAPLLPGWATVGLTSWALCVAWARVALGIHYLLDVLAGFTLGAVLGGVTGTVLAP